MAGVSVAAVNGPASVVVSGDAGGGGAGARRGSAARGRAGAGAAGVARVPLVTGWTRCWRELGQVGGGPGARPRRGCRGRAALTGELVSRAASRGTGWRRPASRSGSPTRSPRWPRGRSRCSSRSARTARCPALGRPRSAGAGRCSSRCCGPGQPAAAAVPAALARAHVHGAGVDWAAVLPARPPGRPAHLRLPAAAVLAAGPPRPLGPAGGGRRRDRGRGRGSGPRSRAGTCSRLAQTLAVRGPGSGWARCCPRWRRGGGGSGTGR